MGGSRLIGATLFIMIVVTMFSIIMGNAFIGGIVQMELDQEALVDGVSSTFEVEAQDVIFNIDTSTVVGALTIISITIIAVAGVTGISVLASGLNAQSSRIIILAVTFTGVWTLLSFLAFPLITSISTFGGVIYVSLTIGYVIGVVQTISGGGED